MDLRPHVIHLFALLHIRSEAHGGGASLRVTSSTPQLCDRPGCIHVRACQLRRAAQTTTSYTTNVQEQETNAWPLNGPSGNSPPAST